MQLINFSYMYESNITKCMLDNYYRRNDEAKMTISYYKSFKISV